MKRCLILSLIMIIGFSMISYGADEKGSFSDVEETAWYYPEVQYVVDEGLMNGVSEDRFDPNAPVTRGMVATILWRFEELEEPEVHSFSDVKSDAWYTDAVHWITNHHVAEGYGNGVFGVNDPATREQIIQILYCYYDKYRNITYYNSKPLEQSENQLTDYEDYQAISEWAEESMKWAVDMGILKGDGKKLNPQKDISRAEMATLIHRFYSWITEIDREYGYRYYNIMLHYGIGESVYCEAAWTKGGEPLDKEILDHRVFGKENDGWFTDIHCTEPLDVTASINTSGVLFSQWKTIRNPLFQWNDDDTDSITGIEITDNETGEVYDISDSIRISNFVVLFSGMDIDREEQKSHPGFLRYKAVVSSSEGELDQMRIDFDNEHVEVFSEEGTICYYPKDEHYLSDDNLEGVFYKLYRE